jgi:hypothetical protein
MLKRLDMVFQIIGLTVAGPPEPGRQPWRRPFPLRHTRTQSPSEAGSTARDQDPPAKEPPPIEGVGRRRDPRDRRQTDRNTSPQIPTRQSLIQQLPIQIHPLRKHLPRITAPTQIPHIPQITPVCVGTPRSNDDHIVHSEPRLNKLTGAPPRDRVELGCIDPPQSNSREGALTQAQIDDDIEGVTVNDPPHIGNVCPQLRLALTNGGG